MSLLWKSWGGRILLGAFTTWIIYLALVNNVKLYYKEGDVVRTLILKFNFNEISWRKEIPKFNSIK